MVAFNILVVDDSLVMRSMIIRILRLSGLPIGEVYQAQNGREGLKILEEKWVDLALVDINMPVMNGVQMIEAVRNNMAISDLPIIVVSTESNSDLVKSIRQKNVEFVHKPFTPEILRSTVLQLTGVSNEQFSGENSLQESGPDF
jgi:two-component system, chemotaxis family, chemotaxis protein CheY